MYLLRSGEKIVKVFEATAHQAAREAARFASRGTYIRTKTMHEQPEGAHGGVAVKLVEAKSGDVMMSCAPSLRPRSTRGRVSHTFARCDIKPAFKRLIKRRRRV